jgi:hypothetical protein
MLSSSTEFSCKFAKYYNCKSNREILTVKLDLRKMRKKDLNMRINSKLSGKSCMCTNCNPFSGGDYGKI